MKKTKYIKITTQDPEGFREMSGMVQEIRNLIKEYSANYEVSYHFENKQ